MSMGDDDAAAGHVVVALQDIAVRDGRWLESGHQIDCFEFWR